MFTVNVFISPPLWAAAAPFLEYVTWWELEYLHVIQKMTKFTSNSHQWVCPLWSYGRRRLSLLPFLYYQLEYLKHKSFLYSFARRVAGRAVQCRAELHDIIATFTTKGNSSFFSSTNRTQSTKHKLVVTTFEKVVQHEIFHPLSTGCRVCLECPYKMANTHIKDTHTRTHSIV